MCTKYASHYQKKQDFLNWCRYWIECGSAIRLNVWKPMYASVIHIERNSEALYKKYGGVLIEKERDFFVKCEDGSHGFMSRKAEEDFWKNKVLIRTDFKWIALVRKSTEEVFE